MATPLPPYQVVLPHRCTLGEGPLWDARTGTLYWVDILESQLHSYRPASAQHQTRNLGSLVGAVALTQTRGLLAALQNGVVLLDPDTGVQAPLAHPEAHLSGNRYNDGQVGPGGRFWVGSMALDEAPGAGALYRIDPDGTAHTVVEGVGISNGLAWSPDQLVLYYIDSPERAVFAFDYDMQTGVLSRRRVAFRIPEKEGVPDGMCIDAEGMLWIAHWDGWQVARWNPYTGEKLLGVSLPAARITSCCFGGAHLDDLYITSARIGLDPETREAQPEAGALFVLPGCGFSGREPFRFGGPLIPEKT